MIALTPRASAEIHAGACPSIPKSSIPKLPPAAEPAAKVVERLRIKMNTKIIEYELEEGEVRALRDALYGPCTDNNWEHCKHNWMRPDSIKWLMERQS